MSGVEPPADPEQAAGESKGTQATPDEIAAVAGLKPGTEATLAAARDLLLDPAKPSTLKLLAIEKLRTFPAAQATPVLAEFLASTSTPGNAYSKPTAVKALVDFRDPAADAVLAKLAQSPDERVRLAVASLRERP